MVSIAGLSPGSPGGMPGSPPKPGIPGIGIRKGGGAPPRPGMPCKAVKPARSGRPGGRIPSPPRSAGGTVIAAALPAWAAPAGGPAEAPAFAFAFCFLVCFSVSTSSSLPSSSGWTYKTVVPRQTTKPSIRFNSLPSGLPLTLYLRYSSALLSTRFTCLSTAMRVPSSTRPSMRVTLTRQLKNWASLRRVCLTLPMAPDQRVRGLAAEMGKKAAIRGDRA
mmetsp:Transcript_54446/g.151689  ORF Transcript_54446/g.151689 Transcript_54446/m.151689 type:complete len:220 (+) Transcript_54446:77-736(+)